MKDTKIPLDIIFINEDMEVISVYQGEPENENIAEEDDVRFVLEVNQGSGIKEGDELDIEEDEELPKMKVIAPDGSTQMEWHFLKHNQSKGIKTGTEPFIKTKTNRRSLSC